MKKSIMEDFPENKYNKQAEEFLKETKTTLKIIFKEYGKYFPGDTEKRNIYRFTLKNKNGSYSSTFGDSINNTQADLKPNAYDILACLQKYDVGNFEEFCSYFGYDADSRKAEKTYKACEKQYAGLKNIFTSEELEKMAEIQKSKEA